MKNWNGSWKIINRYPKGFSRETSNWKELKWRMLHCQLWSKLENWACIAGRKSQWILWQLWITPNSRQRSEVSLLSRVNGENIKEILKSFDSRNNIYIYIILVKSLIMGEAFLQWNHTFAQTCLFLSTLVCMKTVGRWYADGQYKL